MSYFTRPDKVTDKLHVITTVFNPRRYRTRWALFNKFKEHITDLGAELHSVEISFGEREESIREEHLPVSYNTVYGKTLNHTILHLKTKDEIWLKEAAINLAIQRLPEDWKYVAIIDADVHFARQDIVGETLAKLQHYSVIQMFSEAQDLDINYVPFMRHKGFVFCHLNGYSKPNSYELNYYDEKTVVDSKLSINVYHPGYAWAYRREAIDHLGGLIDWAILGASDNHMAKALIGDAKYSVHPGISQSYLNKVLEWENRAEMHIRHNIGYVDGLLLHNWHSAKANRQYWDRWKILVDNKFDPEYDLKRSWTGLPQLVDRGTPRSIKLRDQIRQYFAQRDEDSTYLPPQEVKM